MEKNLICEPIGYVLEGLVAISMWGGGEGTMPMDAVKFNHKPSEKEIKESINDGGFGCESYLGAVVRIDTLYTHGARVEGDPMFIRMTYVSDSYARKVLEIGHEQSKVNCFDVELAFDAITNK